MVVKDRVISSEAGGQHANSLPVHHLAPCLLWHTLISSCTGYGAALGHHCEPLGSGISPAPSSTSAGTAGWQQDGCGDPLPTLGESALGTWVLTLPHGKVWGKTCQEMASSSSSSLDG